MFLVPDGRLDEWKSHPYRLLDVLKFEIVTVTDMGSARNIEAYKEA
jgi:hypothetical protein